MTLGALGQETGSGRAATEVNASVEASVHNSTSSSESEAIFDRFVAHTTPKMEWKELEGSDKGSDNDADFVLPEHLKFYEGQTEADSHDPDSRSQGASPTSWSEELTQSPETASVSEAGLGIAPAEFTPACVGFTNHYKYLLPERGLRLRLDLLPTVLLGEVPSSQCMFLSDAKGNACSLPFCEINFASVCEEILKRRSPATNPVSTEGCFCLAHYRDGTVRLLTRARFEVLCAMSGLNLVASTNACGASSAAVDREDDVVGYTERPWAIQAYEMPLNDEYYFVRYTADAAQENRLPTLLQLSASCKVRCVWFSCVGSDAAYSAAPSRVLQAGGINSILLSVWSRQRCCDETSFPSTE